MSTAVFSLNANIFAVNYESKIDNEMYEIRVGIQPGTTRTFFDIINDQGQSVMATLSPDLHKACEEVGIPVPTHLVSIVLDRVITTMTGVHTMLHSASVH